MPRYSMKNLFSQAVKQIAVEQYSAKLDIIPNERSVCFAISPFMPFVWRPGSAKTYKPASAVPGRWSAKADVYPQSLA